MYYTWKCIFLILDNSVLQRPDSQLEVHRDSGCGGWARSSETAKGVGRPHHRFERLEGQIPRNLRRTRANLQRNGRILVLLLILIWYTFLVYTLFFIDIFILIFYFLFVIMFYKFNFVIWSVYKKEKKVSWQFFFQTNKKIIINCVNLSTHFWIDLLVSRSCQFFFLFPIE